MCIQLAKESTAKIQIHMHVNVSNFEIYLLLQEPAAPRRCTALESLHKIVNLHGGLCHLSFIILPCSSVRCQ